MTTPVEHERAMLHGYNLIDSALRTWEHIRETYTAETRQQWEPAEFLRRVFPGATNTVILREQGAVGAALTFDDVIFAFPFTWPRSGTGDTNDTEPAAGFIADYYDYNDPDETATNAFDTGLTESAHGSSATDLIFNGFVPSIEREENQSRLADLLAVEALVLTMPEHERPAVRTLLALRGIRERPLCDNAPPAHHPRATPCKNTHRLL